MKIRRFKNLYQVRSEVGTLFQSHDLGEAKAWMNGHRSGQATLELGFGSIGEAVKYHETFTI